MKTENLYTLLTTPEYDEWYGEQGSKDKNQIDMRLLKIQEGGYFGDFKLLGEDLFEMKWKSGRRIYFAFIPKAKVFLLLGGNKNGQDKDINKAKSLLKKIPR